MDTTSEISEKAFNAEEFRLARLQRHLEDYRGRLQTMNHPHPLDRLGSTQAIVDMLLITPTVYFQNDPQTVPHSKLLEEINTLLIKSV